MDEIDMIQYHSWLLKRSLKGYLYRRYYLYPKIWRHVQGSVLDVGCGIGDFVRLTPKAIGVDINRYNVDYCVSKSINAVFFSGSKLPFNTHSFDTVVFDNVLEHIHDSFDLLNEAIRVLNPGGKLIIGVPVLRHFFHDSDHKVYHSDTTLAEAFGLENVKLHSSFYTPSHKIIRKFFKHTCRWYVYKVT